MRRLGQRHDSGPDAAKEACAGRATAMRRVRQSSPDDAGATGCGRTGARVRTASTAVATARVDAVDLSGRLRAREPRSLCAQERRRLPPSSPLATKPAAKEEVRNALVQRRRLVASKGSVDGIHSRHALCEEAFAANLHCQHCCRAALAVGGCRVWIADIAGVAPGRRALAQTGVAEPRRELCSVQGPGARRRSPRGRRHRLCRSGAVAVRGSSASQGG